LKFPTSLLLTAYLRNTCHGYELKWISGTANATVQVWELPATLQIT